MSSTSDSWEDPDGDGREQDTTVDDVSAREFFDTFAWEGPTPDPERTSAREFLQWL